ncbi:MAG: caspase family protein, partial [Deltaproteobacteria bacterium]|nr:caspase family protein [Deltaproteobacteria bacterium]
RILIDARATTKAILDGLAWLTDGAARGDSLVFHYSGHGSQVPDRNGAEKTDRLDEILCPYDLDWDRPLTDDDLAAACTAVPKGALLTVILDCCHSGTGLREFVPTAAHVYSRLFDCAATACECLPPTSVGPAARTRPRFLAHPGAPYPAPPCPRRPARRFGVGVTRSNAVLIAACRDDQTSADAFIDGGYHGAHTYYLCRALREADRSATYRDIVAAAGASIARAGFDQIPQLEGPAPLLSSPFPGNGRGTV